MRASLPRGGSRRGMVNKRECFMSDDRAQAACLLLLQSLEGLGSDSQFSDATSLMLRAYEILRTLQREGRLR